MILEVAMNDKWKNTCLESWKGVLDLDDWIITTEAIAPEAVMYDPEIPAKDRYYVGVQADPEKRIATIYHDRDLTEEDIVHELLHVAQPEWSEWQVNRVTELLLEE